jgi:hypothetical protein
MTLDKSQLGKIAEDVLQATLEEDGKLVLNPKTVRRDVLNAAKKFGLKPEEAAAFVKVLYSKAFTSVTAELDAMMKKAE